MSVKYAPLSQETNAAIPRTKLTLERQRPIFQTIESLAGYSWWGIHLLQISILIRRENVVVMQKDVLRDLGDKVTIISRRGSFTIVAKVV